MLHNLYKLKSNLNKKNQVIFNFSTNKEFFMSFKMDNKFEKNPLSETVDYMSGFKKFQNWDIKTTEQYWKLGMEFINHRYGINTKSLEFNTKTGTSFINIDDNGNCNQTETITEKTNAIIMPMTFTGCNNYRLEHTNFDKFDPNNKPIAHLSEFFMTFLQDVNLRGTYAKNNGFLREMGGDIFGGGIAFGRYVIEGKNGEKYHFDMRSHIPSRRWPGSNNSSHFTSRFQINSLNGIGTGQGEFYIIYPQGENRINYPWYLRNNWWFNKCNSYPELTEWDNIPGNISKIKPNI